MTDQIPEIPDETLNPNTAQQCQKDEQEETPPTSHPDSQSPQNPQISNPPNPDSTNPNQDEDTIMEDPIQPQNADDSEHNAPSASTVIRRAPKRKKSVQKRTAQERKSREKFQVLVKTLKPVPFVPAKALNFDGYKSLLQRLGLWDFVHIEFDSAISTDLIAQLIAGYSSAQRGSYVNGTKIMVNRADLGRALKIPVLKKNSSLPPFAPGEITREDIDFINELVSNWMLLHDDAYIMPEDVLGQLDLIKEGTFEKVDWAGLIWSMLEKELKAPQLVDCYYASHLLHLIKAQHKELLEEKQVAETNLEGEGAEVDVKGEEEEVDVNGEEEEEVEVKGDGVEVEVNDDEEEDGEEEEAALDEVDGSGDVKMGGIGESRVHELEEHDIELSLGQDKVENLPVEEEQDAGEDVPYGGEQTMDFEQLKDEDQGMWLMDQKSFVGEPFLRQCHNSLKMEDEDEDEDGQEQEEEDEDPEEDEHENGFHLSRNSIPLEGMSSGTGSLIQAMEAGQMPFTSGIDLSNNLAGDFLSARDDPQMISGSSLFGNGHKRDLSLDNHNSHHSLNGSNKRHRNDNLWNSKPDDFETCMEQMEHWMGKARMMYASKDQACEEVTMNQQILMNELQKRESVIEHLQKARIEEMQKRQMEVNRLEKELYMMQSLVDGYRNSLRETQKAFTEYRARCPQGEEPLYKDVPGSGGLVVSVMELEKERLEKEEEEKTKLREVFRDFEKNCRDIEGEWMGQTGILNGHLSKIESLGNRLQALEDKVKHLKEVNAKSKIADTLTSAPSAPLSEAQAE